MALITVKNAQAVVAGDTNDNEVIFQKDTAMPVGKQTAFIEVIAGTIRFAVGEVVDVAKHRAWAAGSKFPITIENGFRNLHFKAAAGSDSFVITV
jgi:hypothetical protein